MTPTSISSSRVQRPAAVPTVLGAHAAACDCGPQCTCADCGCGCGD